MLVGAWQGQPLHYFQALNFQKLKRKRLTENDKIVTPEKR